MTHFIVTQPLCNLKVENYFKVTLAPSASSLALISSASSLEAPSLSTLGAPSTTSLASFSPRPVASRTTLITLTLLGPTSVSSTSNSVFSSAAAAPSPHLLLQQQHLLLRIRRTLPHMPLQDHLTLILLTL